MTQERGIQVYKIDGGEEIKLSPSIVKQYLVSGDSSKVTDQELTMFMALCKFQKLNPFLREAYIIKYGTAPATIVTGKEAFLKRAKRNPKYRGHRTGVNDDSTVAWAEVYVEGYLHPIRCEVDYDEYAGRKRDGTITEMWEKKKRTMLKKVALVQSLREAFPDDFGGMYSEDELSVVQDEGRPATIIEVKTSEATEKLKKKLESKGKESEHQAPPSEKEAPKDNAEPEKEEAAPSKGSASPAQIKKIQAVMCEMGLKTEDEQLDWIGFNFEIQIPTVDGLSKDQANQIIKALEKKNG